MTKINVEAYVCDFCGAKALQMAECILCKKNMCTLHDFTATMRVETIRTSNQKVFYNFKIDKHICPECESKRSMLLRAAAIVLNNEADRIDNEPPPDEL